MKYVVLVSHGTFAQGLHSVLKMLAGGETLEPRHQLYYGGRNGG